MFVFTGINIGKSSVLTVAVNLRVQHGLGGVGAPYGTHSLTQHNRTSYDLKSEN